MQSTASNKKKREVRSLGKLDEQESQKIDEEISDWSIIDGCVDGWSI